MKKYFSILVVLVSLVFFPQSVLATSGACSYHGGVSCSAGSDWDGSVICNDGWRDSGVSYSSMVMCQSYSTPTCPSNSYYDGVSSCKCYSGYLVSGGSCVSADSVCWNQVGYSSSYDSLSNSCQCNYGYVIGASGQCVSTSSFCSAKLGLMSQYNSLSKSCECMAGYEYNGSSCIYKSSNYGYVPSTTYTLTSNSPTPSFTSGLTKESCVNAHGINSDLSGSTCTCKDNYMFNRAQQCMPAGEVCKSEYGAGGIPSTYSSCGCAYGYHLDGRSCIADAKPVRYISASVKKWVDDNYALSPTPQCSSNVSFSTEELKTCDEYNNIYARQKYDWQIEKPTASAVPTTAVPTATPTVTTPPIVSPVTPIVLPKPKGEIKKPVKPVMPVIEKLVIPTTTPSADTASSAPQAVQSVVAPRVIPFEAPKEGIAKRMWKKFISWF